jgi:hypothetical protein
MEEKHILNKKVDWYERFLLAMCLLALVMFIDFVVKHPLH